MGRRESTPISQASTDCESIDVVVFESVALVGCCSLVSLHFRCYLANRKSESDDTIPLLDYWKALGYPFLLCLLCS